MGSVNFFTGTNNLNLAVDIDFIANMYGYDAEEDYEDIDSDISMLYAQLKAFVEEDLPHTFFHKVELNLGEHSGFQVYIDEGWTSRDAFEQCYVDDWNKWKCFTDLNGYEYELEECPYFRKNIKNVTYHNISQAIDREYKALHNLILSKAKELGLGEVFGRTWTSSVGVIESKLMS